MYQTKTGRYDEIPEGMKRYINNYGCHFNKKLCDWAVKQMYRVDEEGEEEKIKPFTKEQTDRLLEAYGVKVKRNKLHDAVYAANMGKADYLGRSVPDEKHLALFIKDLLDDPDAKEGFLFNRFYADCMFMGNPVEWDEMI